MLYLSHRNAQLKNQIMNYSMLCIIKTNSKAILWSYGNYEYRIDTKGKNATRNWMIMLDTDLEQALEIFNKNFETETKI